MKGVHVQSARRDKLAFGTRPHWTTNSDRSGLVAVGTLVGHHLDQRQRRQNSEFRLRYQIPINMAPPSQLAIATSAVNRLVKEEASYYKELKQQEASIAKLEQGGGGDENADFQLKQEVSMRAIHAA